MSRHVLMSRAGAPPPYVIPRHVDGPESAGGFLARSWAWFNGCYVAPMSPWPVRVGKVEDLG